MFSRDPVVARMLLQGLWPHLLIKSMRLPCKYELPLSLDCVSVLVRVQTRDADAFGATKHCCAQHNLVVAAHVAMTSSACATSNIDGPCHMTHLL